MALPKQTTENTGFTPVAIAGGKKSGSGWIGWAALGLLLIAVAVLVSQVVGGETSDGSFERAEQIRQQQLAQPEAASDGFDQAESMRFQGLARAVDSSSQTAEDIRFQGLAPAVDSSSQTAEDIRFYSYAPDHSSETAEQNRMKALAPAASDGSYEVQRAQPDERPRFLTTTRPDMYHWPPGEWGST